MSNDATSMYSTWFSGESAGYWERSLRPRGFCALGSETDEPWERRGEEPDESPDSLTVAGFGERLGRRWRKESVEGERDGGKEEREGWRCRPALGGGAGA